MTSSKEGFYLDVCTLFMVSPEQGRRRWVCISFRQVRSDFSLRSVSLPITYVLTLPRFP